MTDPQPAEGLLDTIAEQALDDDYYVVDVNKEPATVRDRLLTAAATASFAGMITVAAVQTQQDRPAAEAQRQALADDVETRQQIENDRRAQVNDLQTEVAALTASADRSDPAVEALFLATAGVPVRGPGLTITITPVARDGGRGDVRDTDLQNLANGLWALGAEAISINGHRLGPLSSIRYAGGGITVNLTNTAPPYVVRVIGPSDELEQRLDRSPLGQDWQARADSTNLGFEVQTSRDVRLPAVGDNQIDLEYATAVKEDDS